MALKGKVEERRAVRKRDRRPQRRESRTCDAQPAHDSDVPVGQVVTLHPHARPGAQPGARGHGQLDGRRRPGEHPVPLRGRRPGNDGRLTRPQPRRPHPRLVREPVAADQDDSRVQSPPAAFPQPPACAVGGIAVRGGLGQGHHPGLARHQLVEHAASVRRATPGPWAFDRSLPGDRRLRRLPCASARNAPPPAIKACAGCGAWGVVPATAPRALSGCHSTIG